MKVMPGFWERAQASATRVRNAASFIAFSCFALATEVDYPPELITPGVEFTVTALAFHAVHRVIEDYQNN